MNTESGNFAVGFMLTLFGLLMALGANVLGVMAAAHHSARWGCELSPAWYRIPFRIAGVLFTAIGLLALFGLLSFRT